MISPANDNKQSNNANGKENEMPVIQARGLAKQYRQGNNALVIFEQLDFSVYRGQRIAIVGASGSGKSTLLSLLGGLDRPTSGQLLIGGQDVSTISDNALSSLRNRYLGFVYQFHHLLPEFTALENVMMPRLIAGESKRDAQKAAASLLSKVGLSDRLTHKPSELSGGERQRVAIARALVNNPQCVLMDEPTGNLDEKASSAVESLIKEISQRSDTAFVVVTHDMQVASTMDSIYQLAHGKLNERLPIDSTCAV